MTRNKHLVSAAALAGTLALTSFSAAAFFNPFNMTRGWGGNPWDWDGYGWNNPYYYGGYPYYGGWGHPYYGGWGGYPYHGGWSSPYWGSTPYLGYPTASIPTTPAAND